MSLDLDPIKARHDIGISEWASPGLVQAHADRGALLAEVERLRADLARVAAERDEERGLKEAAMQVAEDHDDLRLIAERERDEARAEAERLDAELCRVRLHFDQFVEDAVVVEDGLRAEVERLKARVPVVCPECYGRGDIQEGTGHPGPDGGEDWRIVTCPACDGRGAILAVPEAPKLREPAASLRAHYEATRAATRPAEVPRDVSELRGAPLTTVRDSEPAESDAAPECLSCNDAGWQRRGTDRKWHAPLPGPQMRREVWTKTRDCPDCAASPEGREGV